MKRIISILLCVLILFSLVGCKGKQKAEDAIEETTTTKQTTTEKTTTTTTLPTTTKEKVTLLSCCPTLEEYIETLEKNNLPVDVEIFDKGKDSDHGSASIECSGYKIYISYSKTKHYINGITVTKVDSANSYSDSWINTTYNESLFLVYLFLNDVPGAIDTNTFNTKQSANMTKSDYSANSEFTIKGIKYSISHIFGSALTWDASVEIDENYMVTK